MRWLGFTCLILCIAGASVAQVRTVTPEGHATPPIGGGATTIPGQGQPGTSYQGGAPDLRGTLGGIPGAPQVLNPDGSVMEMPAGTETPSTDETVDNYDVESQVVPPSIPEEPEDGDGEDESADGDAGDPWWTGWAVLLLIGAAVAFLGRAKR